MTTYKNLQTTIKAFRDNGVTLQCKLDAKSDVLQAELARIEAIMLQNTSEPYIVYSDELSSDIIVIPDDYVFESLDDDFEDNINLFEDTPATQTKLH